MYLFRDRVKARMSHAASDGFAGNPAGDRCRHHNDCNGPGADSRDARLTGIGLFDTGRFAEAIPYFDQVIAQHGRDIDILNKRGICHLRTEQPGKAMADFDRIIEHSNRFARSFGVGPIYSPNQTWIPQPVTNYAFPQAHGNRGIALLMLGRNEEALQSFTTAVNLWNAPDPGFVNRDQGDQSDEGPRSRGAYEGLGQSYHRLGQDEQAFQAYTQAISIDPSDPNGYAGRGDCLTSLRLLDQAVADFTEAIRLDSSHSRAHAGRGTALADQGRFAAALTDFDRAIALDPKFARAYSFRGALHAQMGRNPLALADYDTLIGLIPADAGAYKDRGGINVRLGRFDAAIKDLNESIRLDPQRAKAYLNRGAAYNGLAQYEKAIDDLSEAIRLEPESAGAFTNRGLACFGAGRYDQAIVDLSEAIQLAPRNAIPYFNRAEIFARLGVRDRAVADYNEALRLEPGLTAAQTALVRLHDENSRLPEAIPDIDMALQLDSKEISRLQYAAMTGAIKGTGWAHWLTITARSCSTPGVPSSTWRGAGRDSPPASTAPTSTPAVVSGTQRLARRSRSLHGRARRAGSASGRRLSRPSSCSMSPWSTSRPASGRFRSCAI